MKRILVGRGNDCDIVIPDEKDNVSRHHMVITFSLFGKMTISDTSSNGTFINGKRMLKGTSIPVTVNDRIRLGDNWDFDWKQVEDPYKSPRRNIIFIISLFVIAMAGIIIWHTFSNTEPTDSTAPIAVPKNSAQQNDGSWNKDSTKKVAPTEMSIPVNHKETSKENTTANKKPAGKKAYSNTKKARKDKSRKPEEQSGNTSGNMPVIN